MQKIILVSNTSWYLYNFRLSIIELLVKQGFEVICIANYDEYSKKLEQAGATFIRSALENKGKNPVNDYLYFAFLYKTYKQLNPAFIFHYTIKPNIYGSVAAKRLGIKSIAVVSGAGYVFIRKNILNYVTTKLYKTAANSCKEMWFVNKEDQQLFVNAKIVKQNSTKVLPGEGINTDAFKRETIYPANNKNFTFLLSGRLLWDKGVGIYVKAAKLLKKKYPDVKFELLGFLDAENPSAIKKGYIHKWEQEGTIEYLGATDNVKKFLSYINCFVLPSFYREGVPRALLEAASMEIPLIATDSVGCREVVENGYNGFLCAVKDVADLAAKMELMINMDSAALQQMGKNGRKKVKEQFHEDLVLNYYKEILNTEFNKRNILI